MITQLGILSLTCEHRVLDLDLETSNLDLDLDLEHFFLVTRLEAANNVQKVAEFRHPVFQSKSFKSSPHAVTPLYP